LSKAKRTAIRVLVADDEAEIRDAYRQILLESDMSRETAVFRNLRDRLFTKTAPEQMVKQLASRNTTFAPVFCEGAETAVAAVRDAIAAEDPFAVVFLDMRMPPGPDGVWAAGRIREMDPAVEIVVCTAYSDVDPADIGGIVPPEEKLSYLQKPFHPHEIRQMTISLASKWRAEHRIVKLAYFDALTGLPNREQSRSRLNSALEAAKVNQRKIDRSFITSLVDCSDDRAIAAAIIAMSRSLRISVMAEGVESFPQLLFLQEHDCQEAQGCLFSRALPAADAHKLLRRAAETSAGSRTERLRHLMA